MAAEREALRRQQLCASPGHHPAAGGMSTQRSFKQRSQGEQHVTWALPRTGGRRFLYVGLEGKDIPRGICLGGTGCPGIISSEVAARGWYRYIALVTTEIPGMLRNYRSDQILLFSLIIITLSRKSLKKKQEIIHYSQAGKLKQKRQLHFFPSFFVEFNFTHYPGNNWKQLLWISSCWFLKGYPEAAFWLQHQKADRAGIWKPWSSISSKKSLSPLQFLVPSGRTRSLLGTQRMSATTTSPHPSPPGELCSIPTQGHEHTCPSGPLKDGGGTWKTRDTDMWLSKQDE